MGQTCKPDAIATKASEINLEIASHQAANSNVTAVDDVITVGVQVGAAQGKGREINFIASALEVLNDINSKSTVKDESIASQLVECR